MKQKFTIIISILFILFISVSFGANGQNAKTGSFLELDRYLVPVNEKGAVIGSFMVPSTEKIIILQDQSKLFEIKKGNVLSLKRGKSILALAPMSYKIVVKYKGAPFEFELVKDDFVKNKVVAHRGGWKHSGASQNTLGALQHAIDLGCEGSELDVWLTKDKRVLLNHDADLDGRIIEKTTAADLQQIKMNKGEVAPTLEDYIRLVKKQNKTRLVIELKSNKSNERIIELADSVVNIVHRMNAQAWVDYISFDYRGLKKIREMDATAHLAFLEPTVDLDLQKIDGMNGVDYHYSHYDKIEKLHERCLKLGLTMNTWTVNDEVLMKRFLDIGVDFITTDEPELLLKLVGK